jgi:hypothetical protein
VLVIDSAQTARVERIDYATDMRTRVGLVVAAAKRAAHTHNFLVLLTSELARGAYRSQASADETNPLAAFKETGAIEYAAETAIVLRNTPGGEGLIDVTIAKNRGYQREPLRLEMDRARRLFARWTCRPARHMPARVRFPSRTTRTRSVAPGINGKSALRAAVRARGSIMGNDRVDAALALLERRGELENRGSDSRPRLYLRAITEAP